MATHVVWDWNGTLLDDLHCCVEVANTLLGEFGLPLLDGVAAYQSKFRFPIIAYYDELGFDISAAGNFDAAARRYLELYATAATSCGLHTGARDVLEQLRAAGIHQVVISASEQANLHAQLAPFGLEELLDGAHGIEDIYAASKEALARRWIAEAGVDASDVVFVGDSEHDFEIAAALGAGCVLFSGGHHARAHLDTLGVPVVDRLAEVPALVLAS
jgi:phosphoglycolate phosphatase